MKKTTYSQDEINAALALLESEPYQGNTAALLIRLERVENAVEQMKLAHLPPPIPPVIPVAG